MGHLDVFRLLPTRPGTCPECGVDHDPGYMHDATSLTYQYRHYDAHGRWPNWRDAMAHCPEAMQADIERVLREMGIDPDGEHVYPKEVTP